MKIHNTFEIEHNGQSVNAENTVTNAGKHLRENLAYAAYIVIRGADGVIVRKSELVKICKDVSKGTLSASYRIELGENEYSGFVIENIGFSPYADGHETANSADFAEIKKETGHALVVTGTVYVSLNLQGAYFFEGGNPLSDFFLGLAPLEDTDFFAAPYSKSKDSGGGIAFQEGSSGGGIVFQEGNSGDGIGFQEGSSGGGIGFQEGSSGGIGESGYQVQNVNGILMQKSVTPVGFRLIAEGAETGADGIVILFGDKPVLRLPSIVSGVTKTVSAVADFSGRVKVGGSLARISEVLYKGKTLENARIIRTATGSYDYKDCPIKLGRKGYLLSEPSGRFFAAVGEKDVMLFSSADMGLIRILKNRGDRAALTEDGAIAFFGDSLVIVSADGFESEYPVYCDGQSAIVQAGEGQYYVLAENGGFLMRYLVGDGATKLLGMAQTSNKLCLFRFGRSVAEVNGAEIYVGGAFGRDAAAENVLAGFALQFALKAAFDGGDGLVLIKTEEGEVYAGDLICGTLVGILENVTLCEGVFLVPQDGYAAVCVFDYEPKGFREILRTDEDTVDVAVCGDLIVTKNTDGGMKIAKIVHGDTYVYHGDIADNAVEIRVAEDSVADSPANVSVYFDF